MNMAGLEAMATIACARIPIECAEIDLHSATLVRQVLFRQCRLCNPEALVEGIEVDRHVGCESLSRRRRRSFLSFVQQELHL